MAEPKHLTKGPQTNVVVQKRMFDDLEKMIEALTGATPSTKAELARRGLSLLKQDLIGRIEEHPDLELDEVLDRDEKSGDCDE